MRGFIKMVGFIMLYVYCLFCLLSLCYIKVHKQFGEYNLFKMGEINEDD